MASLKARRFLKKLGALQKASPAQVPAPEVKHTEVKVEETAETTLRIKLPEEHVKAKEVSLNYLEEIRKINETFPLVTVGEMNLATANISFNNEEQTLAYTLTEPQVDEYSKDIIERTLEELHERLDIKLSKLKKTEEIYEYLNKKVDEIWAHLQVKPSAEYAMMMKYYIFRDTIGLDRIDALMQDPNIEDISCDGIGLPIFIFHRNPIYGEMATNIIFPEKEELDSFVMKLAQKANRSISVATPLLDGSLEDGSRVQITYGTDIARRGSNFTIRKFFKIPLTPIDLINYETVDAITLAYLWYAIEKEKSLLIAGSTATGKTTFLNALTMFINPASKIVSIEDTAELQLPHTNWMPQITRAGFGPSKYGEIDMHSLLKSALRQRPDYLIVGEVRGVEANVLFQAMATGHPGLSTIHADNIPAVIDRLTTPPIELPLSVLQNLDIIIFLEKIKREGRFFRKLAKVVEVESFDAKEKDLRVNDAIFWNPANDKFKKNESYILSTVANVHNLTNEDIQHEVLRRANILKWMHDKGISRFEEVSKILKLYYINPQAVTDMMRK